MINSDIVRAFLRQLSLQYVLLWSSRGVIIITLLLGLTSYFTPSSLSWPSWGGVLFSAALITISMNCVYWYNLQRLLRALSGKHPEFTEILQSFLFPAEGLKKGSPSALNSSTEISAKGETTLDLSTPESAQSHALVLQQQFFRQRHEDFLEQKIHAWPKRDFYWPWGHLVVAALLVVTSAAIVQLGEKYRQVQKLASQGKIQEHTARNFRAIFPAYMEKSPQPFKTLPQPLDLPFGTQLEISYGPALIHANLLKSVLQYLPQQKNGQVSPSAPLIWQQENQQWTSFVQINQAIGAGMRLHLVEKSYTASYEIRGLLDLAPQITVKWPNPAKIFANSKLMISLSLTDDYGLQSIKLYYTFPDGRQGQEIIQSFEKNFKEYQEVYPWDLGQTSIHKGDQVKVWIEAYDNNTLSGPSLSKSEVWSFNVQSVQDFHQTIVAKFWQVEKELSELLALLDRRDWFKSSAQEMKLAELMRQLQLDTISDSQTSEELKQFLSDLMMRFYMYQDLRRKLQSLPPT